MQVRLMLRFKIRSCSSCPYFTVSQRDKCFSNYTPGVFHIKTLQTSRPLKSPQYHIKPHNVTRQEVLFQIRSNVEVWGFWSWRLGGLSLKRLWNPTDWWGWQNAPCVSAVRGQDLGNRTPKRSPETCWQISPTVRMSLSSHPNGFTSSLNPCYCSPCKTNQLNVFSLPSIWQLYRCQTSLNTANPHRF